MKIKFKTKLILATSLPLILLTVLLYLSLIQSAKKDIQQGATYAELLIEKKKVQIENTLRYYQSQLYMIESLMMKDKFSLPQIARFLFQNNPDISSFLLLRESDGQKTWEEYPKNLLHRPPKTYKRNEANPLSPLMWAGSNTSQIFFSNASNVPMLYIALPPKTDNAGKHRIAASLKVSILKHLITDSHKKNTPLPALLALNIDNKSIPLLEDASFEAHTALVLDKKNGNYIEINGEKCLTSSQNIKIKNNNQKLQLAGVFHNKQNLKAAQELRINYLIFSLLIVLFSFLWTYFTYIRLKRASKILVSNANAVIAGDFTPKAPLAGKYPIFNKINAKINLIAENMYQTEQFIRAISRRDFNYPYTPDAGNKIGRSLISLRNKLIQAIKEQERRYQIEAQENKVTEGTAKFAEIIRENSENIQDLSYAVISNLVDYLNVNQGGLFIVNESSESEKEVELVAGYAYSRKKLLKRRLPYGSGLIGRCMLERETIYMTKIPEDYLSITSGLGEASTACLLIVPLIFRDEVFGVVELSSFSEIQPFDIQLVEKVSEAIASAISMVKMNMRTTELLTETKIKSEQAASQEEEIRQNIEEMQTVTEELNFKLEESDSTLQIMKNLTNFVEFDLNGRLTDISDNYRHLLKRTRSQVLGHTQGSYKRKPDNLETFETIWDALRSGKEQEQTFKLTIGEESFQITGKYYPVKDSDGKVYKVIGIEHIK